MGHDVLVLGDYLCLWTLGVVDLIAGIMTIAQIAVFFLLLLDDSSPREDVESCLGLGDNLSILMFLQADVLFLACLLGRFLVD